MKITSFKETAYFTCIKTPYNLLKTAVFACQDTAKHIYTHAVPAYAFSTLSLDIYNHATNILSKSPLCFGTHLISESILEGPSFVFNKIQAGAWLDLLPTSIRQQIFGVSKEEAKQTMSALLCRANSPEIAEEYLEKHLNNRPPETMQLFCDDKTIQECAKKHLKACPSLKVNRATDTVCSDVSSDIATIQNDGRRLGALLSVVFIFYFIKNLYNSKSKAEKAPLQPIVASPKTRATDVKPSILAENAELATFNAAPSKEVDVGLEQLFNNPYFHIQI